jgi:flagellar assembly protein FliH
VIVREVVMAGEPRALKPLTRIASELPEAQRRAPAEERRQPAHEEPHRDGGAPAPTKPVLAIEAAGTWLAAQSPDLRAALARGLADDIEGVQERSRTQGVEAGRTEGLREVAARTASGIAALGRISVSAEETFTQETAKLAELCADIVSEAFLKIAGEHLASREATIGAVLEVLKRIKDERELIIHVSSQDLPLLRELEPRMQEALGSRRWTMVADPRVSAGGCLVESSLGALDGRFEVQLQELFETIRAAKAARWEGA